MPKITVSVSNELMAKLDPLKDRINISQVCREALERRIASFENTAGHETLDLEGLVQRLRDERSIEESKFEDLGKGNAERWLTSPVNCCKSA